MFRYYIISIFAGIAVIFAANALFVIGSAPLTALLLTLLCAAICFALDAAVALLVRYALPERYYDPLRRRFAVARFEKKLYLRLGIRAWKDKIPETGGLLVGFQKSHALDLRDNEYVLKFMRETCYAEVMHLWSALLSFVILPFFSLPLRLTLALPVALVNFVLQLLPILVQRFVRPQLLRVYKGNLKRVSLR